MVKKYFRYNPADFKALRGRKKVESHLERGRGYKMDDQAHSSPKLEEMLYEDNIQNLLYVMKND